MVDDLASLNNAWSYWLGHLPRVRNNSRGTFPNDAIAWLLLSPCAVGKLPSSTDGIILEGLPRMTTSPDCCCLLVLSKSSHHLPTRITYEFEGNHNRERECFLSADEAAFRATAVVRQFRRSEKTLYRNVFIWRHDTGINVGIVC
jgi:hypothetical protein